MKSVLLLALCIWFAFQPTAHAIESKTFHNDTYDIQTIDLAKTELHLYWKKPDGTPYRTLNELRLALRTQKQKPRLLVNSGIYDKDERPLGLHIENGKTLRKVNRTKGSGGNFGLRPNGVFIIRRASTGLTASVVETSAFKESDSIVEATQSGPMLLIDGKIHLAFTKRSENKKIRNGVGVDRAGHVVFAISRTPVSFYDFADFYRTALDCPNALYLDGTISMMIDDQTPDAESQLVGFVGMWAAY